MTNAHRGRGVLERTVWFGRLVLLGAALLFTMIAKRYLLDPAGASAPFAITLGSGAALTNTRVGQGGFPLAIAIALVACLLSTRRLRIGLGFLCILAVVVTAVRLLGLALDGPDPWTLHVLKPELVLIALSTLAFTLERRRRQLTWTETDQ